LVGRVLASRSFPLQSVEKLVKHKNVLEFLCKDFRVIKLRMEVEAKRSNEENEAVWKQAYYAFTAYVVPGYRSLSR
jgi:hypothetical protein